MFIGRGLDVQKIVLAEDQTSMAIKMFSIMSLGRGVQLAEQMVSLLNNMIQYIESMCVCTA